MTITVGIRELKARLSEHLRRIRSGDTILVTDRGEVVAEINPPGQPRIDASISPALLDLARRGLVILGAPNDPSVYPTLPRLLPDGVSARLLDEERGER
jgi:antitoxin (DNA-binding transcriptional repressor) of toxin-antitoxin stability system